MNEAVSRIRQVQLGRVEGTRWLAAHKRGGGFTLIELLVVIAIIGVLASMLLPVVSKAKVKGQVAKARTEITDLVGAINSYYSTYSRLPASKDTREALADVGELSPDFTYGTRYGGGWWANKKGQPVRIETAGVNQQLQANNSELIAILKDMTQYGDGRATPNVNHSLNPKQTRFLDAKEVDGPRAAGIGRDGVYRDPWGNPYIITVDLNYDDQCRDGFYRQDAVSADRKAGGRGLNGLAKKAGANTFEYRGQVMVWSLGPDGLADATRSAVDVPNRDNILSWK